MSTHPVSGAGSAPAETRSEPAPLLPRPHQDPLLPGRHEEPLLPRFQAEGPSGGWPADVRLPDDKEDDEC